VAVKRGLRLARRLADPLLQSAALDALAGIAQSTGDHAEARERARQRIEFEDRLDLTEHSTRTPSSPGSRASWATSRARSGRRERWCR
jgi:hypothetical protein